MTTYLLRQFVVVAAMVFMVACKGKLPTEPTQTTCQDPAATNFGGPLPCTYPSPNGGVQYPTLPHRECAKDLETGEELPGCRMWAELQAGIKPPRGSTVKVGPQYCPAPDPPWSCLEFDVKFGFKGIDNPITGMGVMEYWSTDGKTPGERINILSYGPGAGEGTKHHGPLIFQTVPRYLLIELSHGAGYSENHPACAPNCDKAEVGWVSFFLGYKGG